MPTDSTFELTFWGTRGTIPVPGESTLRYGGNTSCVSLAIGRDRQFVFDAGTGLRRLSQHVMSQAGGRFNGRIFISHPHWDHFNCLPFFTPFYIPGNRITVQGPAQGSQSMRNLIDAQMNGIFFPITVDEFQAEVTYLDMEAGDHWYDGIRVSSFRLRHPGYCLAYRVEYAGRRFAYVTDNELGEVEDAYIRQLADFLAGVDVLVHDCTYFDEEYPRKTSWGHSSIGQVVRLAHQAGIGRLYLFHHDPEHGDREIDLKLESACALIEALGSPLECAIAVEGSTIDLHGLRGRERLRAFG